MKHQRVTRESPTESGLDRKLTVTRFNDPKARTKSEPRVSLRTLAAKMPARIAASKAELPLLKLATFGGAKTAKGSLRNNANVLAIEGVEGDYDGERMTVEEACAKLRKAGLSALIYTSPSHRPGKPRWRVLCPTSRPLPPGERERLIARVMGVLDGKLAAESFTLSQTYYYGAVAGQPAPHVELVEGRPVDLADNLDARALDKRGEPYGAPDVEPEDDGDDLSGEPDAERIAKALDSIPAGKWDDRELWLTIGMALHHEFNGGGEGLALWNEASQWSDKYDADDQERVWESFGSRIGKPVTIGTLYRLAKEHGRKPQSSGRLRFLAPGDCADTPSRGYVVKGLLAPGDVACIFGAPGAGKSLIAPHIGYQVALGEPVFGMRTKPGGVFYVAAEDAHGMRGRVTALARRHGDAPGFLLVEGVSDLLEEDSADLESLIEAVADKRPALIVLDTLAMSFPGLEENTADDMGRVVRAARELAEHGAAVVLIHHDTKAAGSTPRGHSLLNGALDIAIHVIPSDDGVIRGRLTKNRNGPCDRDVAFRISTEELGHDEDGDAITAALVEELAHFPAPSRAERLSASEREALAILAELATNGDVSEVDWREACIASRRVSGSEERANRRKATDRAIANLARKHRIIISNGNAAEPGEDFDWPDRDAEVTSGGDE